MTNRTGWKISPLVWAAPLVFAAACSGHETTSVKAAGPTATPCPVAGGPPPFIAKALMKLSGAPPIVVSTSVAPGDITTSKVISPDPRDQIACGKVAIKTTSGVVFSTPTLAGHSKTLKMDILAPQGAGLRPLVIYVPGGGFMIARRDSALDLRTHMAEAGFVVASIEYRTTQDHATYRDGVADVKSAVRYLRAHARELGIDPARIAVWGESAGGYMVAMVGATNGRKEFDLGDNLDQSSDVQAVIDKFGASDVSRIGDDLDANSRKSYADPKSSVVRYMNGQASTAGNPITYIQPSTPAFLIFHGDNDRLISPSQTLTLHNALTAAGVRSTRYVLKGAGHGDMSFLGDAKSGLPWSTNQVMGLMADFLHREIGPDGGARK